MDSSSDPKRRTVAIYGRYRVDYDPLRHPPYGLYVIYCGKKSIGAQISWVSRSDAEWYASNSGTYATADESHKPLPYREQQAVRRRTGRPTNAERAAREAALLTEIPE